MRTIGWKNYQLRLGKYAINVEVPGLLWTKADFRADGNRFFADFWGMPSAAWKVSLPVDIEAKLSLWLGGALVAIAVLGVAVVIGPILGAELRQVMKGIEVSKLSQAQQAQVKSVETVSFTDFVAKDKVLALVEPVSREFGVIIPKIDVNAAVMANVDASNKDEYLPALKEGLVHAAGTGLPGGEGDIFIFGHSTDYAWNIASWNALFYNLKDLEVGDKVYVYYQGNPRIYVVKDKGIFNKDDVSFLHTQSGSERLVLQTCYPPGTTLKRLVVFAELLLTL